MELHHIHQLADGGEDSFENCIPLCFDCHGDMGKADPHHPKGRHYTTAELQMHRDNWYTKCSNGYGVSCSTEITESDKELFKTINDFFDKTLCDDIRYTNFRYIIPNRVFQSLHSLYHSFDYPTCEFINPELEKNRAKLFEAIDILTQSIAGNTFQERIGDEYYSVTHIWLLEQGIIPRGDVDFDEYINRTLGGFNAEADELQHSAEKLWETYCEFVRQGRRLIGE